MRPTLIIPVHLVYLIISLLDDAASAYAQEAIPNSNPYISQQQWRYLSNSSCYEIKLVRRAEEVELGDEMALCTPQSACEPCPKELLHEPFCQPFGNRRLLHCMPAPSAGDSSTHDGPPYPDQSVDTEEGASDTGVHPPVGLSKPPASMRPAWESCGRLVPKERADFFEFVLCNIIFVALTLTGVLIRSERMRVARARRLAARIGVGLVRRASGGTWTLAGLSSGSGAGPSTSRGGPENEGLMRHDESG